MIEQLESTAPPPRPEHTHEQLVAGARALASELAQWGLEWEIAEERANNLAQALADCPADETRPLIREFVALSLAHLLERQLDVLERAWARGLRAGDHGLPSGEAP